MRKILLAIIALIATSCMSEQEKVEEAVKGYCSELGLKDYSPIDFGEIKEDNYKVWYDDSIQKLSNIIQGLEWTVKHNAVNPLVQGKDTAFTILTTDDDKRYYLIMYRNKINDFELLANKIDTTITGYRILHRYNLGSELQNEYFIDKNYKVTMLPDAMTKENIINLLNEIDNKRSDIDDSLMRLRLNE